MVNRQAIITVKSTLIPISIFNIRSSIQDDKQDIKHALRFAGWDGNAVFEGENYLMAELIIGNQAAEYIIDQIFNSKSRSATGWWNDTSAIWKVKFGKPNLSDFGNFIGYAICCPIMMQYFIPKMRNSLSQ